MIRVPCPAKLNLFLHITGQRTNGYHELQTIFQLIDLYDWLEFEPNETNEIILDGLSGVEQKDNLIYKAAEKLKPYAQKFCGLNIRIEKNIPLGVGSTCNTPCPNRKRCATTPNPIY